MTNKHFNRLIFCIAMVMLAGSMLLGVYCFNYYRAQKAPVVQSEGAKERVKAATERAVEELGRRLSRAHISGGYHARDLLESTPEIFGLGVAYAPELPQLNDTRVSTRTHECETAEGIVKKQTFAPYYKRSGNELKEAFLQYDYTDPASADNIWYSRAMEGRSDWYTIYGKASGALISVYSSPLFLEGGSSPAGAIIATHTHGSPAEKIGCFLRQFTPDVHQLAAALEEILQQDSSEGLNASAIEARLQDALSATPYVLGIGAAFNPEMLREFSFAKGERYAPYFKFDSGGVQAAHLEYDYTDPADPDSIWYAHSSTTRSSGETVKGEWHAIYGKASRQQVAVYSYPIRHNDQFAGVILLTIPLHQIRNVVAEMTHDKDSFVFIADAADANHDGRADGRLIIHPHDVVSYQKRLTIHSPEVGFGKEEQAIWAESLGRDRHSGKVVDSHGRTASLSIETIEGSNMKLCTYTFHKSTFFYLNGCLTQLRLAVVLGALALILLKLSGNTMQTSLMHQSPSRLWGVSVAGSIILVLAICALWHIEYNRINDPERAARSLAEVRSAAFNREHSPVCIPTGVFLQSLEFANAFNIDVSGYIWQKYRIRRADWERAEPVQQVYLVDQRTEGGAKLFGSTDQKLSLGFILPESVSSSISEAYRRLDEPFTDEDGPDALKTMTIGWYVETTLRQPFHYTSFPFDHEDVWLRLWHQEFDRNIILVPDQNSYVTADPTVKIGLEESLPISGWRIEGSYFDYKESRYNTNFGIRYHEETKPLDELHFNVALKRNFSDAFIGHVVPVLVVLFMLFALLITISPKASHASKFGSNAFGTLGATSALFFVVLMGHIQLRNTVQVLEVMYLEYLYFLTYVAILFITVFAIAIIPRQKKAHPFFRFRHSIAVKLLFWPLFLGLFMILTACIFNGKSPSGTLAPVKAAQSAAQR